jgi:hypothetical protein
MNQLDSYILDCVSNGKKPGGVKISNLKKQGFDRLLSDEAIYSLAKNMDIPKCLVCNTKHARLISFSKGYSKYCSLDCYSKELSKRNSINNQEMNKKLGKKKREENTIKFASSLNSAVSHYLKCDAVSISELSNMYNVPGRYIREKLLECHDIKHIPQERRVKAWKNKLASKMQDINNFLEDKDYLAEVQKEGKTTKIVAKEIGCSANYVAVKSRELGLPFKHNTSSSYEIELNEFLSKNNIKTIQSERSILDGYEIDIFIPEYNLGIEVNGTYWHQYVSDKDQKTFLFGKRNKDKNYHQFKTNLAEKRGVQLLHIFDYEYDDDVKLDIFKSIILGKCGYNKKIYARKCEIKELSSEEYQSFLEFNHIKGKIASKIKIGLFFDNDLIMVSGFSKPRFNKRYEWELIRMCTKKGFSVVGGASKIFKYFTNKYEPETIISYCDRKFFNGDVYKKLGMKKINSQTPNYVWVKNNSKIDIKTRYDTQKHKISDETNKHLTEDQIMKSKGYMKIYDCGQDVFVWKNNEFQM